MKDMNLRDLKQNQEQKMTGKQVQFLHIIFSFKLQIKNIFFLQIQIINHQMIPVMILSHIGLLLLHTNLPLKDIPYLLQV